jgi:lysophospholipase L1-like esterase
VGVIDGARTLALLAALLAAAPAAQARSVSVAVVGDSVQEGYTVQDFADGFASSDPARAGLAPALQGVLGGRGYGLVPAHRARWTLAGDWLASGYGFGTAGPFGASGYGLETGDGAATATTQIEAGRVAVLYWRGPGGGTLTVTAGDRTWSIATAGARSDGGGETWLHLPPGATGLTVRGPADGGLVRFLGIRAGSSGPYDVLNLAHGGRRTGEDLTPANRQAFLALHPDVTLLLSGTVDQMTSDYAGGDRWLRDFEGGLRIRARMARRTGRCAIVPPPPLPVKASIQRSYLRAERRIAREERCTFAPVLAGVWRSPEASIARRLTREGVHPTRAGYARVARALVPLVRELQHNDRG